jgi:hypothetical protein
MFSEPEPMIAPFLGMLGKVQRIAERIGRCFAFAHKA